MYRQNCLYRKIFQKIDSVLISRIGIILSTLGGFLVAPDLIGIKRIENFQNWLIRSAGFLRPPIENAHYWAQYDAAPENPEFGESGNFNYRMPEYARTVFFLSIVPIIIIILILRSMGLVNIRFILPYWVMILVFGFIGPFFVYIVNGGLKPDYLKVSCISLIILYPFALLYLTGLPLWYFFTLIFYIALIPINIIETALSGKNSLKKILTKIGIAILILGAILQLSVTK